MADTGDFNPIVCPICLDDYDNGKHVEVIDINRVDYLKEQLAASQERCKEVEGNNVALAREKETLRSIANDLITHTMHTGGVHSPCPATWDETLGKYINCECGLTEVEDRLKAAEPTT